VVWDKAGGGYFFTAEDANDLITRTKARATTTRHRQATV
jgi:hypothetical protein